MRRCKRRIALTLALALLLPAGGCAIHGRCGGRECAEEAALRLEVEQLFAGHPELRPPNVLYVAVHEHRVTLTGQVNSEYERRLAEAVAHEARGVTEVVNLVALTYSAR
jgi:hypothetical protein